MRVQQPTLGILINKASADEPMRQEQK